jgi:hypothetical protein
MLTQPPEHSRSMDPPQPGMSFWIMHDSSEHVVAHWSSEVTSSSFFGVIEVSSQVGRVPSFVHLGRMWIYTILIFMGNLQSKTNLIGCSKYQL